MRDSSSKYQEAVAAVTLAPEAARVFSFPNDSVSIAASIILSPLIIDVVQMTMFLRPRINHHS